MAVLWIPALAAVVVQLATADLPVHCLRHQLLGRWQFFLVPAQKERSSCGHARPDVAERQPPLSLLQNTTLREVELLDPNVAHSEQQRGRWTMIYDEAFEVKVDGLSFLAFSRFELQPTAGGLRNVSHCGETQLGWYRNELGTAWGCFYAKKVEPVDPVEAPVPVPSSQLAATPALPAEEQWSFVATVNLIQDLWKARVYERFVNRTLRELNGMAGIFRRFTRAKSREADPYFGSNPLSFLQRARAKSKAVKGRRPLPTQWDWRNVSGRNYLDAVIDQGTCGSCYMVATTHMLAARYRIKYQDPGFEGFSFNFPLFCSEYNQGCEGGYAFLAARWASDVGLVPKNCSDEDPQGLKNSCELKCSVSSLSQTWKAVDHHYVGGYYGAASEEEMKRELVEDGPLVVSFEPQSDLMYYSGGIYSSAAHQRAEWEPVDHAVLLVGYGSENGRKYWLLQNSWGNEWGEAGFMRMLRGVDESGIESIAEAASVELARPGSAELLQFVAQ